jgi:hypothetical protein
MSREKSQNLNQFPSNPVPLPSSYLPSDLRDQNADPSSNPERFDKSSLEEADKNRIPA